MALLLGVGTTGLARAGAPLNLAAPAPARATTCTMGSTPYWLRSTFWNPDGVDVPFCIPEYVKAPPEYLKSSLPGDAGFDPLCLTVLANPKSPSDVLVLSAQDRKAAMLALSEEEQQDAVAWMREAELKHARLAMLAAVGWPMAELWNGGLAQTSTNGRVPSLFNGGLFDGLNGFAILSVFVAAGIVEANLLSVSKSGRFPGDLGFDPLKYFEEEGAYYQKQLRLQEIKNGRLAMMAITGYAVQEFLWGSPVVAQTPFFFGR